MYAVVFYAFVLLTVLSAVVVLWSRNVLYSAFSLMITFLGMAALYVTAGADFLAVTQLMVYVGGILILLIFGVMLTRKTSGNESNRPSAILTESRNSIVGLALAGGIFGLLMFTLIRANFGAIEAQNFNPRPLDSKVMAVGMGLMTNFVLPFELIGVLLMIALMGAAFLTQKQN
jgi:NADH:ubiquinone oxidoreductase subunit 6 (subunit J)